MLIQAHELVHAHVCKVVGPPAIAAQDVGLDPQAGCLGVIRATAPIAPASHKSEPLDTCFLRAYTHCVNVHRYVCADAGPTIAARSLVASILLV